MSNSKQSLFPSQLSPQAVLKICKSERTRTAILNAALDFVWLHPFHEMTVKSLMVSTGVGRAAFYQYFNGLRELMETLLDLLQDEIFVASAPWITGTGDPVALMHETIGKLVRVCYERGPLLKAIFDSAASDKRFEKAWRQFLGKFDDAGSARIIADQELGLIPELDPYSVMFALNRLNTYTIIDAFGQHPRKEPEPIREALARIWSSSLYGAEYIGVESSNLVRT
jgi:TetR/AcrR family transcriptional regulator, ethionamide resistance regulator